MDNNNERKIKYLFHWRKSSSFQLAYDFLMLLSMGIVPALLRKLLSLSFHLIVVGRHRNFRDSPGIEYEKYVMSSWF